MQPETRYARSGEVRIAYQVFGSGPLDLVFVPGFISNLDHYWDDERLAYFLTRLGSFSRVIMFDKRGTGLSDRIGSLPSLEERMDDLRAVMDAVGSQQAAVFGVSEGGPMSILFAATYPDRCQALVLYGSYPHFFSFVTPKEKFEAFLEKLDLSWGTGETVAAFASSRAGDERFKRWWAKYERVGASPSAVLALMRMNSEIDVRHVLPTIRQPTLVLHRTGDARVSVDGGRYLAANINGAKLVELPGVDHALWAGEVDPLADEIQGFLTGSRANIELDRILATVMFTDIVDSTQRSHSIGDHAWHRLLEQHNRIVRTEIARHRGREIKTLGDGFLVSFDGPARAVRCATAVAGAIRSLGLEIKIGLHTGEVEILDDDIRGIAVHLAARIAALATGGQVLVSSTVRDLIAGSAISLIDCGYKSFKGFDEGTRLFSVA